MLSSKGITILASLLGLPILIVWSQLVDRKRFTGIILILILHYSVFEAELADSIPVIHSSIAGIRSVGCLTAGKSQMFCL